MSDQTYDLPEAIELVLAGETMKHRSGHRMDYSPSGTQISGGGNTLPHAGWTRADSPLVCPRCGKGVQPPYEDRGTWRNRMCGYCYLKDDGSYPTAAAAREAWLKIGKRKEPAHACENCAEWGKRAIKAGPHGADFCHVCARYVNPSDLCPQWKEARHG